MLAAAELVTGLYLVVIPGLWLIRRFRSLVVKGQLLGLTLLCLFLWFLAASPPSRGVAAQTGAESRPCKRLGAVAMAGSESKRRTSSRTPAQGTSTRSSACAGGLARPTRRPTPPPLPRISSFTLPRSASPPSRTSVCSRWRPRGTEPPLPRPCHAACSAGSRCSSPTLCRRLPSLERTMQFFGPFENSPPSCSGRAF